MKYTWTVTALGTETIGTQDGYVLTADFNVVGKDGQYTSTVVGSQQFAVTGDTFIPYANLTNTIVVGWIKDLVNVADITAFIDADLANQKNPPVQPTDTPLPWS